MWKSWYLLWFFGNHQTIGVARPISLGQLPQDISSVAQLNFQIKFQQNVATVEVPIKNPLEKVTMKSDSVKGKYKRKN